MTLSFPGPPYLDRLPGGVVVAGRGPREIVTFMELPIAFKREGDRFFARQTDILNPEECGISVEDQAAAAVWVCRKDYLSHKELRRTA